MVRLLIATRTANCKRRTGMHAHFDGFRTTTSGFTHRKKTANNNHIKIRTVSYNQSRPTLKDADNATTTAAESAFDRPNMSTQFVWLRKPVGVPTQERNTSPRTDSFGFRTFYTSSHKKYSVLLTPSDCRMQEATLRRLREGSDWADRRPRRPSTQPASRSSSRKRRK